MGVDVSRRCGGFRPPTKPRRRALHSDGRVLLTARLTFLHRQLLKRLALDRERGRLTQREMRQPHIGKAHKRPA